MLCDSEDVINASVFIKMKVYQATLSIMDALLSAFYLPKLLLESLKPKMHT
jgi:hypothetical protein